jgi:hypothetical protein
MCTDQLYFPHPYLSKVHHLEAEIKDQTRLVKKQVDSPLALQVALEGSDQVVYVTHDYLSMAPEKNKFLEASASKRRCR